MKLFCCLGIVFTVLLSPIIVLEPVQPPNKERQQPPGKADNRKMDDNTKQRPGGMGQGGPGGPGGIMQQERKLVAQFDKDKNGRLSEQERQAAREFLKNDRTAGRGMGPRGFNRGNQEPAKPGAQVAVNDVKTYGQESLYDSKVLRTFFVEFENKKDWEAEMADFYHTDVEIPATLIVDGKRYPNVGVHFRGASSFFGVSPGYKRSLNIAMDFVDDNQRLLGYKTLNLLNSNGDSSFMSTVLYSALARDHIAAPKANFAKVVINGESWGVYVNVQQFNKDFLQENYKTTKGARWKVKGSPGGASGLDYIGDNIADYQRRYDIKSGDNEKDWKALIQLCKTLSQTPVDQLEEALKPILNIDGALWFLALDNVLVNSDGYWVRASDYSIYRDPKGMFHIIPHDMNESFSGSMGGPGMGGRMFGNPAGMLMRPLMEAADTDKNQKVSKDEWAQAARKLFAECDKEKKGSIDEQKLGETINRLMPPPPGAGGPPPGMQGFGPGNAIAAGVFRQAKVERGQVLSENQFLKSAETFFQENDKDKNGTLEESEISAGINSLMPAMRGPGGPPGPGGPGGFGGGPGGPPNEKRGQGGPPETKRGDQDKGNPPGKRDFMVGGPGGPPGMAGGGINLDPMIGMTDVRKPLRSRLLAVPSLKARYLEHVKTLAEKSLDWKNLGPQVKQHRELIEKEIEADTKKLTTYEAFKRAVADAVEPASNRSDRRPGGMSLRAFADQRRKYLLENKDIKQLGASAREGKRGE